MLRLADASSPAVTATLPDKPIAVTGSNVDGLDLEVWSLQRTGTQALTLVFALHNRTDALVPASAPLLKLTAASVNISQFGNGGWTVSSASVVDGNGLKQYLPFVTDPARELSCVCSKIVQEDFAAGHRDYYAAVLAAPPVDVKVVAVVTGMGSVGNVPIG